MTKISEIVKKWIEDDISSLNSNEQRVQENESNIEITKEDIFWDGLGRDPIEFLRKKITPLIKYKKDLSLPQQRFILNCEKYILFKLVLDKIPEWWTQPGAIEQQKQITEDVAKLPTKLPEVEPKKDLIHSVRDPEFWNDTSIEDIIKIMDELGPLMKHQRSEVENIIEIMADDRIFERKPIIFGPNRQEEHVEVYKEKVEKRVRELADSLPAIQKIKEDQSLTPEDIESLEDALNAPDLYITKENLNKIYQRPGEMVEFMKHILDVEKIDGRLDLIDEAFRGFEINHNPPFTADQLLFLRMIQTVFERKHHIEKNDLYMPPFKNLASPTPLFKEETLDEMVSMCSKLEKKVF